MCLDGDFCTLFVDMSFKKGLKNKNLCVRMLWMKVISALEGSKCLKLKYVYL